MCTTTTKEEEEEEVRKTNDNATIDDEFTTSTTTQDEDKKSNNYYNNIDNETLRTEFEGTIVFEEDSLVLNKNKKQPCPTTTAKDLNPSTADELAQLVRTVAKLLNEDTVEFINGILL